MRILILGCGVVGLRVGQRLVAAGHAVTGIRRTPVHGATEAPFPVLAADAGELALHAGLGLYDAVLLAANPGIRRGKDNGLARIARIIATHHRSARAVYTGTTSLYGDAQGGAVDEHGALDDSDEARALQAIEKEFLEHPDALALRATALVGPTRTFTRERIIASGGEVTVKGDLERPFSYLHEDDLADLCVTALLGGLGQGVLNAAAPEALSLRSYYELLAHNAGVTVRLTSDGSHQPSRRIDAACLYRRMPHAVWQRPG